MIIEVNDKSILTAAIIHSESWKASHVSFCSDEFVALHTVKRQLEYLRNETQIGKHLYMLVEEKPVGIVSVADSLIENLYVLPCEQRKGYGTKLLRFAIKQCNGVPHLWILDNNNAAYTLYVKHGFRLTGNKHVYSDTLSEIELALH